MRGVTLAISFAAILLAASACGSKTSDTPAGGIAIGKNAAGHPAVTIKVCDGTFDHIEIRKMLGGGKSEVIGAFETTQPVSAEATIDLVQPGGGWKASHPLKEASGLITANAWGADDKSGASNQATFTFKELVALSANHVISDLGPGASKAADGASGPSMTLTTFKSGLCSRWGK